MLYALPPGSSAPAVNRQSNQLLGQGKPIGGLSQGNTLGAMNPVGPQLSNPNPMQLIIKALLAKGGNK